MTTFTHEPPTEPPAEPPASSGPGDYPVSLTIDYVDGDRDRLTVFFRFLLVIPISIVLGAMTTGIWDPGVLEAENYNWVSQVGFTTSGSSLLFVPALLMILFRQKYPRWWFEFNLELLKFSTRVNAYGSLLADKYPSTDEEQGVHLTIEYPDATQLNRYLPLVKWLLAIPHYIVLIVLYFVAIFLLIFGWLAILVTGRFPRWIHDYIVGVTRWSIRVQAYSLILTTDKYPPFSLD